MNHVTEITLLLFWIAYFGLHAWLLRTPRQEAAGGRNASDFLQGETSCTTPATK